MNNSYAQSAIITLNRRRRSTVYLANTSSIVIALRNGCSNKSNVQCANKNLLSKDSENAV